MKTITFYSYKGGVGRTLALANTAKRLSEFKKKICILDFDLEAPGLHLKFPQLLQKKEDKPGIVDYMYDYVTTGAAPESIKPFTSLINFNNNYQSNIDIIAAGRINQTEYWKKLSSIHWNDFFYEPESQGVSFFIDLKEKIKKELQPDYLLVDSRTGISEISGITLSILADEIVIVSAYNEENLSGVSLILNSIVNPENLIFEKTPKIHFVLSRIPFPSYKYDIPKEESLKESIKNYFSLEKAGIESKQIIIIHSDPELEFKESLKIGYEPDEKSEKKESVAFDYLELFKRLIYVDLKEKEIEQFKMISEAENLYQKSKGVKDREEKINLLTRAIELMPGAAKFYFDRGETYGELNKWQDASDNFLESIKLESSDSNTFSKLGVCYLNLKEYDKARKAFEEAIKLNPKESTYYRQLGSAYNSLRNFQVSLENYLKSFDLNPLSSQTANGIANTYRMMGNLPLSLKYISKSLELNPKYAVAYSTLAEIKAQLNQTDDFYLFTSIALKLDNGIAEFFFHDPVYTPFLSEERFKKICENSGVDLKSLEEKQLKEKEKSILKSNKEKLKEF